MAARATRSARRTGRRAEAAVATGPLGALSHDELGVIVDGLADPLQPVVAVALSSTCLGLRTPLGAALEVLKERHARAVALCRKLKTSCVALHDAENLYWGIKRLTTDDMVTLGMILQTGGLPHLSPLYLDSNGFGDVGLQALCEGLDQGVAPSLRNLNLFGNKIGPAGAEALAAALRRGAMPKLQQLDLGLNPLGNQGVAALAAPLRKLPALRHLSLSYCEIGDEGVSSLVADLGKDGFKALTTIYLHGNNITDAGCTTLVSAIDAARMPRMVWISLGENSASSEAARRAVDDAVSRAKARRSS